jgi:hypothetical protein
VLMFQSWNEQRKLEANPQTGCETRVAIH